MSEQNVIEFASGVTGKGRGRYRISAFDSALVDAGVGNLNLVKVTSILPPRISISPMQKLFPGLPVLAAYSCEYLDYWPSGFPSVISAGVAVGYPSDPSLNGVIMEHHGQEAAIETEYALKHQLEDAFAARRWDLKKIDFFVSEVERDMDSFSPIKCAFAAIMLYHGSDIELV